MRRRFTRIVVLSGLIPAAMMLTFVATASASVPDTVAVYGSSGKAAGVHLVGGTSQFESFGDGAVNNRYPLAAVGQEAAPAAQAVASPADYGPLAATVFASDPPQPFCTAPAPSALCTPQTTIPHDSPPNTYAQAQYPSPPGKPEDQYSSGASDHADARARELGADATGTYAGGPTSLFSQATAEAHTVLNADGSLKVNTHSHVNSANFGAFIIRNVDVVTSALSAGGKGSAAATVNPGIIDKGDGNPTAITVAPAGQTFSIPSNPPVTVHVFAVSPEETTKGETGSICATGTHVVIDQPSTAGQFSHNLQYILGEGCSEAFVQTATPPEIVPDLGSLPVVTDSSGTPSFSTTTSTSGNSGVSDTFTGAAPSTITKAPAKKVAVRRRTALLAGRVPMPLAAMFLLWEALVLGAASATVWARHAAGAPR
ncbi:MAG: hypothetical protein QOK05_120 [Chloroflexota bacterium]|jgi:hypothetical protein|nr:hypothetical protein [Chloroflexota bacterium]